MTMYKVSAIAHRGFSAAAPENTLAAFRKALEMKADAIECDVHLSKDGHMMVIHDPTVDRTTNGTGEVGGMTLAELKALDAGSWFGPEFTGEKIPTLEEVLDLVKGRTTLIVEIKKQGQEDAAVAAITERGMSESTLVASFHERVGLRMAALNPAIPFVFALYCDQKLDEDEAVHLADDAAAVNASIFAVNYRAITPALVRATHAANLKLFAWTVDDPNEMRRMAEMGADMIASNRVDLLLQVLEEVGVHAIAGERRMGVWGR